MRTAQLFMASCLALLLILNAYADDAVPDPALTPLEMKWLRAGWPVLSYAEEQHLPIDIVVQPQATPGDVPFAMAVEDSRCKLVLSMRNNPEVESILANLPAELQGAAIEAMTAHEVAHCWRYINGAWHTLPAGFVATHQEAGHGTEWAALQQAMRATQLEEGFADLVGLAWTLRTHPEQYAVIHAWFAQVRADQPVAGSFHDTRPWLQLAAQPNAFPAAATPFEQARALWTQGLLQLEVADKQPK